MNRYTSKDMRTGHQVGEVVELSDDALNRLPFNVFMEKVETIKPTSETDKDWAIEEKMKELRELKLDLLNKGLSKNRTEEVLKLYQSLDELKSKPISTELVGITADFIKKTYQSMPKKKVASNGAHRDSKPNKGNKED